MYTFLTRAVNFIASAQTTNSCSRHWETESHSVGQKIFIIYGTRRFIIASLPQ